MCAQQRLRSISVSAHSDQPSQGTKWIAKDPKHFHAGSEDLSVCANAQADPSCHWMHMQSCRKCCGPAHVVIILAVMGEIVTYDIHSSIYYSFSRGRFTEGWGSTFSRFILLPLNKYKIAG